MDYLAGVNRLIDKYKVKTAQDANKISKQKDVQNMFKFMCQLSTVFKNTKSQQCASIFERSALNVFLTRTISKLVN